MGSLENYSGSQTSCMKPMTKTVIQYVACIELIVNYILLGTPGNLPQGPLGVPGAHFEKHYYTLYLSAVFFFFIIICIERGHLYKDKFRDEKKDRQVVDVLRALNSQTGTRLQLTAVPPRETTSLSTTARASTVSPASWQTFLALFHVFNIFQQLQVF